MSWDEVPGPGEPGDCDPLGKPCESSSFIGILRGDYTGNGAACQREIGVGAGPDAGIVSRLAGRTG